MVLYCLYYHILLDASLPYKIIGETHELNKYAKIKEIEVKTFKYIMSSNERRQCSTCWLTRKFVTLIKFHEAIFPHIYITGPNQIYAPSV